MVNIEICHEVGLNEVLNDGIDCDSGNVFYLAIQRSVAFGVILSLLFVFCFFCLYGWGCLNAGWCDRREILAQGRANIMDGNEVVWGLAASGGRKKRQMKFSLLWESMGIFLHFGGYLSNACTDAHQILFVYGQCLPTCPLPLWGPSAPGGRES